VNFERRVGISYVLRKQLSIQMKSSFDSSSHGDSSADSEILEGEVVGKVPQAEKIRAHRKPPEFNIFAIPIFAQLKRNCLLALVGFTAFTFLAIYLGNWWLFFLAILLPPWIFSQKKN